MLVMISKFLYLLTALVFVSMIIYGKLFVFKKKKPQFVSDYCATMAGFLGVYTILSLTLVWLIPDMLGKSVILGFAVAPFIIGLLATYHTEKYYTAFQVILLLLSMTYIVTL